MGQAWGKGNSFLSIYSVSIFNKLNNLEYELSKPLNSINYLSNVFCEWNDYKSNKAYENNASSLINIIIKNIPEVLANKAIKSTYIEKHF